LILPTQIATAVTNIGAKRGKRLHIVRNVAQNLNWTKILARAKFIYQHKPHISEALMAEQSESTGNNLPRHYGFNTPQRLFVGYTLAVLVDLTVLNLFEEFWDYVTIKSFTVSLAAAILLQVLLKLSIAAEHRLANYFKGKEGLAPKVYRGLSTYIILVGSKIIMLEAINILFGDKVSFSGPLNGVVAFFAVIFVILIAEITVSKIYFALEDKSAENEKIPN